MSLVDDMFTRASLPAPAAAKWARRWCRCHHLDAIHDAKGRCMECPCERLDSDDAADPGQASPSSAAPKEEP